MRRSAEAPNGGITGALAHDSYFASWVPGKARSPLRIAGIRHGPAVTLDLNPGQEIDIELNSIQYLDPG
jgi:hypothetical protein